MHNLKLVKGSKTDIHPAYEAWLSSLSAGSQASARGSSKLIASLVFGGVYDAERLPWHALRFQHLSKLQAALQERYAPGTVNKLLAFTRAILKQCWLLDLMDEAAYHKATAVKDIAYSREPAGRALKVGEIAKLLSACDRASNKGSRDAAMIAILYAGGLRRSELVSLRFEDYEEETGRLVVRHGKGDRDRVLILNNGALLALSAWLEKRKTGTEIGGAIFVQVTRRDVILGAPCSTVLVYRMLQTRARQAGVKAFSPHDLRRTAITHLLERGADLAIAQRFAGHATPATTVRYDRRGEEAIRQAVELLPVPW